MSDMHEPMTGLGASARDVDADDRLIVQDLTVAYGSKVILQAINAEMRRGQVIGVIGPNGGGKSTLFLAILGLVPVVSGRVTLFGRPAATMRARIAYVPQREVIEWDFPVTVWDVVMMGRYPHLGWGRRPRRRDRERVARVLERVGMRDHARTQIGQLSGGQQQRVFLARALTQDADVLLLDEPMNGIDAGTQDVIRELVDTERAAGKIILLATHDLAGASCACDCLCCLNQRVISYGPVHETYTPETLAATFGGPVILLDREGRPAAAPHALDHPHHRHVHENLGREHS